MVDTVALPQPPRRRLAFSYQKFLDGFLWVFIALGSFTFIEPAPYDLLSLAIVPLWAIAGFRIHRSIVPLFVLLALYLVGGFFSLVPWFGAENSSVWIFYSVYLSISALFFAIFFGERTERRVQICLDAYLASCLFAAVLGVIGYFDIAGTSKWFAPEMRATGPFKDPNVMGSYTIFGYLYLLQLLLLGKARRPWLVIPGALLLLLAILLSFSRGSWGATIVATLMTTGFAYLTSPEKRIRRRIVLLFAAVVALAVIALAGALSIEQIREMLSNRAQLAQDYDSGVTGRFGNQLRSIPMLLELPNGFGPYRFNLFFGLDPHNSYISAFASYGWLGGFAFLLLVATTSFVGFRLCLAPSPYMAYAQIVWTALFMYFLQAVQIDIDHWRFVFLLLGLLWGLEAARQRWLSDAGATAPQQSLRVAQ